MDLIIVTGLFLYIFIGMVLTDYSLQYAKDYGDFVDTVDKDRYDDGHYVYSLYMKELTTGNLSKYNRIDEFVFSLVQTIFLPIWFIYYSYLTWNKE